MIITLRDPQGIMTAQFRGKSANYILPQIMDFVETAPAKDPHKKIFRVVKDMAMRMPFHDNALTIYFWNGSYVTIE